MVLNRENSEVVVRAVVAAMDKLDKSLCELRGQCSDEDYAEYGEKLDLVISDLTDRVLKPIFDQHPGLVVAPDEEDEE